MPPSTTASGTQTATPGTEHFVYDPAPSVVGIYVFEVHVPSAFAAGEAIELAVYQKHLLVGDTAERVMFDRFDGPYMAVDGIYRCLPFAVDIAVTSGVRCSLKQLNGTGRSWKWKVVSV